GDENLIEHSNTRLTKGLARARKTLLKSLVDKEWIKPRYVGKAKAIRIVAFIGALPLLLLLIGFIHFKAYDTAALLAIPFAFFAGMGFADDHAFQRTASGYARHAQTLAFRTYLKTAETHRLEIEIDEENFSRYLPYAMAYGDVNRWLTLFENAPDRAPAGLGWLNGGAADIVTDSSSRNQFLLRLNLMR